MTQNCNMSKNNHKNLYYNGDCYENGSFSSSSDVAFRIMTSSPTNADTGSTAVVGEHLRDNVVMDEVIASSSFHSSITIMDNVRQNFFQTALTILIGSLIAFVVIDALTTKDIEEWLVSWIELVERHVLYGIVVVVLVYIVATICFVPGSVLTIGVGYAFSQAYPSEPVIAVSLASISVFVGASSGSIICLLMGRYLFRCWVLRLAKNYPLFLAMDRALEGNGLKIMILLRLSPLIPNHALDYISGVTSISISDYSLALLGILPSTIAFCYIGATASSVAEGQDHVNSIHTVMLVAGLLLALSGAILASYYARQELDAIIQSRSGCNGSDDDVVVDNSSDCTNHNMPVSDKRFDCHTAGPGSNHDRQQYRYQHHQQLIPPPFHSRSYDDEVLSSSYISYGSNGSSPRRSLASTTASPAIQSNDNQFQSVNPSSVFV